MCVCTHSHTHSPTLTLTLTLVLTRLQQYILTKQAAMLAGDERLAKGVASIRADALALGDKETGDWGALSAALEAAEKKQVEMYP